ncbi:MAG: ATP-binding protein [Myxococcota bacterium]
MSSSRRILALLRSQASGNVEEFYSVALQIAAAEARQGHRKAAEDIRSFVNDAKKRSGAVRQSVSMLEPRGELEGLLEHRSPKRRLSDVVLSPPVVEPLEDILKQQKRRDRLREYGKTPSTRLLLVGPPGTGKTLTAEALASELCLPLFVVRLESLITRYMGETAAKLKLVFDATRRQRGVYLFDEFDALGANRDSTNDVAEMRRVLNSFLQLMEEPASTDSVLIAATNFPTLLDRALLRRFDVVVSLAHPTEAEAREVLKWNLRPLKYPGLAWKRLLKAAKGLSHAELARAAEDAVKTALLDERGSVSTDDLLKRLDERQRHQKVFLEVKRE